MNERLSRKDIKKEVQHDQFAENVQRSIEYVYGNLKTILVAAGVVAALVVVIVLVSLWRSARYQEGVRELGYAQRVYDAPAGVAEPTPEDPREPSFADEETRRGRAKELFEQVAERHGGQLEQVANLYLAQIALAEGDAERATALWQELADGEDAVAQQARLNLLAARRESGEAEAVAQELESMLDASDPQLPLDVVLFELAQTHEQLDQPDEATSAYQRILDEFPDSAYRSVAEERAGTGGGFPGAEAMSLPFGS